MKTALLFFVVLAAPMALAAEEFCSLTVEVVGPSGNRLSSDVAIEVREGSGHSETAIAKGGLARFCGLGILGVTVTVGADNQQCQTVVRNVRLVWLIPVHIKIIYDLGPCLSAPLDYAYGERNGVFSCSFFLRFFDEHGQGIPGVVLKSLKGLSPNLSGDRYGRIMLNVLSDPGVHSIAEADGFVPERVDLNCPSPGHAGERIIALRRAH